MIKKLIIILSIILSLLLLPAVIYASDLDYSSSDALPYLAPNLDDANAYSLAVKIAEESGTRDVTHTIDDLYSLIISMRTYVNNNYQMRTYDSAVLSAIQDLNGYGTAYNTHSMLMDMWMRIGGNSSLGNTYNITDMLADIQSVTNNALSITDGQESYYISEMIAGIYGQYATPRSIPDLYNKLASIEDYADTNSQLLASIASDTYTTASALDRLADIYASADVVAAKEAQQDYEDGAVSDFTGSGTAAATISDKNNVKSISSTIKSGLNTGGSTSNALAVFNFDTDSDWSWFTNTTKNRLDTTGPNLDDFRLLTTINQSDITNVTWSLGRYCETDKIYLLDFSFQNNPRAWVVNWYTGNEFAGEIATFSIDSKHQSFISTPALRSYYLKFTGQSSQYNVNCTLKLYVYEPQRKSNDVPDFLSDRDREYFNLLNGVNIK